METSTSPMKGLFRPFSLDSVYYGPNVVKEHLLECLPEKSSKAYIITGNSLMTKTPLIKELEALLGQAHGGTFSKISQHAPVAELDEASELIKKDSAVDTLISVGGGSPIDAAKALAYRLHEHTGKWVRHLSIPTTNSAAECTPSAGYTNEEGLKQLTTDPNLAVWGIFYDTSYAKYTPKHLFLSTAIRAMDHAVETLYHKTTTPVTHAMSLHAIAELFQALPASQKSHPDNEDDMARVLLACYTSLGFAGRNLAGGVGLSHSLGYALGSPYGIPHGVTSCLTLAKVMVVKAEREGPYTAAQLARIVDVLPAKYSGGKGRTGEDVADARRAATAVAQLIEDLGLKTNLTAQKVDRSSEEPNILKRAKVDSLDPEVAKGVRQLVAGLWAADAVDARI